MILTDTHTHLYSEEFDQDRNEMMQRAINAGISRMFVPSIDSNYTQKMYELEKQYPDACIAVYNNERSSACFSNLDDFYKMDLEENECLEFMAGLWDRCPWSGKFFD